MGGSFDISYAIHIFTPCAMQMTHVRADRMGEARDGHAQIIRTQLVRFRFGFFFVCALLNFILNVCAYILLQNQRQQIAISSVVGLC